MLAAVGFPIVAAAIMIVMVGSANASWVSPWTTVRNNWAPCSGSNTWGLTITPSDGVFDGLSSDQANSQLLCSPDTTETEINAGLDQSQTYIPASTGSYTITAVFSGSVYVTADQIGCNAGTGHGTFEIGVGAYDANTSTTLSNYGYPSGLSFSASCGSVYNEVAVGSISYTGVLNAHQVYELFGSIDWLVGSSEDWTGTSASAFIAFDSVCYQGEGDTCPTYVTLSSVTVS